ncbi:MAG: hypothetical protein Ct9H300mP11_33460 [Chloroflexota bacterium]|nr:MAG: hypothetical protein Ct9H300mP11_33460 [Chloroflexota bacterium]
MYNALQKTLKKVSGREFDLQLQVRSEGDFYAVEQAPPPQVQPGVRVSQSDTAFEIRSFNPKYTFDTFVPGPSNRLAFSALGQ